MGRVKNLRNKRFPDSCHSHKSRQGIKDTLNWTHAPERLRGLSPLCPECQRVLGSEEAIRLQPRSTWVSFSSKRIATWWDDMIQASLTSSREEGIKYLEGEMIRRTTMLCEGSDLRSCYWGREDVVLYCVVVKRWYSCKFFLEVGSMTRWHRDRLLKTCDGR